VSLLLAESPPRLFALALLKEGHVQAYSLPKNEFGKLTLDPGDTQSYTSWDFLSVDEDKKDMVRAMQGQVLSPDDVIGDGLLKWFGGMNKSGFGSTANHLITHRWSGRQDLNLRPPAPKALI